MAARKAIPKKSWPKQKETMRKIKVLRKTARCEMVRRANIPPRKNLCRAAQRYARLLHATQTSGQTPQPSAPQSSTTSEIPARTSAEKKKKICISRDAKGKTKPFSTLYLKSTPPPLRRSSTPRVSRSGSETLQGRMTDHSIQRISDSMNSKSEQKRGTSIKNI